MVTEWTPKGWLKVKKVVDDHTVIVNSKDVKKLVDVKVIDANPVPASDNALETIVLYSPGQP